MKKKSEIKIIIVENDQYYANLIYSICKKNKYKVDTSDNNFNALDSILTVDYDIYFIDIDNAEQRDFYLIKVIKNIKNHYKIIAISSNSDFQWERKIRSLGITYLLKKPFSEKEVKELIQ